ncbi:conserved hypothetical protein [Sporisorium reilianum SRZ2]|uniref:Zn(2)-C6 fungal-type domain-containing protein n=1 Tax=Sporisorium reilianum (strain SRZ2) TaxID=999809 RepID=E6ZWQ6_SPORE|nr:conserved hypothetical protein [Sporisorium reilianum SRZ2]
MCFSTLAPHTPTTESASSSPTQPLAALSSQLFASVPEAITAEGSTRKRVGRACEVCRRKKVKCNGQKPCSQCIAFAEECNYVDVKDRSAYSRRYVESLEARLAGVENRVAFLLQRQACDRVCEHHQPTEMTSRQANLGSGTMFPWQRQVEQEDQAGVARAFPSAEGIQSLLSLEHSIDLSPLSATYLIEQANAALHRQGHSPFPFAARSDAVQMQIQQQAPTSSSFPPYPSDLDLKREVGSNSITPSLPAEADFLALLESYSQRVYPFFSIVVPSDAHSAWINVSSTGHSLSVQSSSEVALLFAVMACGAQAFTSSPIPTSTYPNHPNNSAAPRYSSDEFDAHARALARTMQDLSHHDPQEASRQVQVQALLSLHAAGRGDSMVAFDHIGRARSLLATRAPPGEHQPDHVRQCASIELLDRTIRSALGRMATQQQSVTSSQPDAPLSQHAPGLLSALCDLSTLCSESGTVGRTIRDLLATRSHSADDDLQALARDSDRHLLDWYAALPASYRCTPSTASDPTSAACCIAFGALQCERVRLHLALQHFTHTSGRAGDAERCDLARCLHVAGETIRKFATVARCVPPSPWLVLYAQCLGASAAFLALTAVREPHCNVAGLLGEVDVAVAGLAQLEHTIRGVQEIRTGLARLVSAIRAQSEDSPESRSGRKRKPEVEQSASMRSAIEKRIRAATMPQVATQVAVSPIVRAETAPPVPLDQPQGPAASLATSSTQTPPGAMSVFYQPAPPPNAGPAQMQWPTQDVRHVGAGEMASLNAYWNAPTSNVGFAAPQQQQQQHSPVIPSQSQGLPFDLQQQQQLMAGLLGDYMIQDQHGRRQTG